MIEIENMKRRSGTRRKFGRPTSNLLPSFVAILQAPEAAELVW
jgi:hypothetical protein